MDEKQNNMPDFRNWEEITDFMAETVKSNQSLASETIAHSSKHARNWFIAFLVTLIALVATNLFWIYEWSSYEYVSQDGAGVNAINTGNQEDMNIGTENED